MDQLLPAVAYQSPPRPARGRTLNTIIEDHEESPSESKGESGTDDESTVKGTVIGRPAGLEAELFAFPKPPPPPTKGAVAAACPSDASLPFTNQTSRNSSASFDQLYDTSDDETRFSESCPSLRNSISSRPTSFATDSRCNSIISSRSRNCYPPITIPRSSWSSLSSSMKNSPIPPTPPPKIPVSPAILSWLPRCVPGLNAAPSLDGSTSSISDRVSNISAPVTPDMLTTGDGVIWGGGHHLRLRREPESAHDDVESETCSSEGDIVIERPEDWHLIHNFPRIPGATPEEVSPVIPAIPYLDAEDEAKDEDQGVHLPSAALKTLDYIVRGPRYDTTSDISRVEQPETEMKEVSAPPIRPRSDDGFTPHSAYSGYSFSQLSIPSPGGFFSSLQAGSRHTWCSGQNKMSNPPSSTTAENFYNLPWMKSERIVERVVQIPETMTETSSPSTARQSCFNDSKTIPTNARRISYHESPPDHTVPVGEVLIPQEIRYEYEEAYESELQQTAIANLDRTSTWLAAQTSYLSALRECNPVNDIKSDAIINRKRLSRHGKNNSLDASMKKAVCFLEDRQNSTEQLASQGGTTEDLIHLRAFEHLLASRKRRDAFVHATPRFDAVQAFRTAMMDFHIDQLLGMYQIHEPTRPEYSGPFSQNPRQTGVFEYTPTQMAFMQVEREKEALDQVASPIWVVEAFKYLNGGRLLASPAARRLAKARPACHDGSSIRKKTVRVLDLGGNPSCDWAWHCAQTWPNVKVYTVVAKTQTTVPILKGPENHRQVAVPHIWQLPFKDGHFDIISARSLPALLKREPVPEEKQIDEYDLCLKECMRVLKPNGYLEYMMIDASISHAGPFGSAMSVEFGFNLKTRGYDPNPTKAFLGRLRKANFVDIKRAWMFLPMGAATRDKAVMRETPAPNRLTLCDETREAVQGPVGSTADVANISGMLGGWMWEQWMLKLQMEMGREKGKLLEGVGAVIEEGRNSGAGWNCLSGWAKKPGASDKGNHGTITIRIQEV